MPRPCQRPGKRSGELTNHDSMSSCAQGWLSQCISSTQNYPSYEVIQTSHHAIPPQLFHSKLKTLLFSKSCPDSSSSPYLPTPVSTPNTIHHSHLMVGLPNSLDLDPLPINFVLVRRLWICWFPWLRFCGCCRNPEFRITNTITVCYNVCGTLWFVLLFEGAFLNYELHLSNMRSWLEKTLSNQSNQRCPVISRKVS